MSRVVEASLNNVSGEKHTGPRPAGVAHPSSRVFKIQRNFSASRVSEFSNVVARTARSRRDAMFVWIWTQSVSNIVQTKARRWNRFSPCCPSSSFQSGGASTPGSILPRLIFFNSVEMYRNQFKHFWRSIGLLVKYISMYDTPAVKFMYQVTNYHF